MKPNDKPQKNEAAFEDPRLYTVIGDEVFPRPGLETVFVDPLDSGNGPYSNGENRDPNEKQGAVVCSCNKVRVVSCGCVSYKPAPSCDCVGYTPRRSSGGTGCRCAPVS